jgi:hypothetical protein
MRQRCRDPNAISYPYYGARGIRVCPRWDDYENFYADMGEPPEGHQLDRLDSRGDYEPGNCRWATKTEQANNQSNNHPLTFRGETLNINQWARRLGVKRELIKTRLKIGWSVEDALTKPVVIAEERGARTARIVWARPENRARHSEFMKKLWAERRARA